MRTLREVLLARHRGAEPKLDEIRRKALASLSGSRGADGFARTTELRPGMRTRTCAPQESGREGLVLRAAVKLWRELIWPCRRPWAGIAAVWLVLLAINLGTKTVSIAVAGGRHTPSAEAVRSFAEEQRVLAELLQSAAPVPAERPRPNPGPRSERGAALRLG